MQRVEVYSNAIICNQDDACQECVITSINANGMLIMAENTHLQPDCYTTVELVLECEDGVKYQSETVRVVHSSNRQVAVAFVDYSSSHLRTFHKLLETGNRAVKKTATSDPQQTETIIHFHRYR